MSSKRLANTYQANVGVKHGLSVSGRASGDRLGIARRRGEAG